MATKQKDDFLTNMLKVTKNKYATIVGVDGITGGDITGYISSGCYAFNALVSGSLTKGFPIGKITALAGSYGSGKTYILMSTIKKFLDDNPDGAVMMFESESAITTDMMIARGIDVNRVVSLPVATVEQWRNQSVAILDLYTEEAEAQEKLAKKSNIAIAKENKKTITANKKLKDGEKKKPLKNRVVYKRRPMMMCLDSVGNLSTNAELGYASEGKDTKDMSRERLLKGASRVITLSLGLAQVPMIITNHIYMTIEKWSKAVMSGGTGFRYTASIVIFLFKMADRDEEKNLIGNNVRCVVDKGRLTREGAKQLININFTTGTDPYYGLVQLGVESGLIHQGGAGWYTMPDGTKVQGTDAIYSNPEKFFDKAFFDTIEPFIASKFCYGEHEIIPEDELTT